MVSGDGRDAAAFHHRVPIGEEVKGMIRELDRVVLTKDLPEEGLKAGDVGTAVHVYRDGSAYEVEFLTLSGETLAVLTVPADAARPVSKTEITHARSLH